MSVNFAAATEMAARLSEVASVVEAAGVEPRNLSVGDYVTVQCGSADEVDRVMEFLADAPAPWPSGLGNYGRWGTFDEVVSVQVFGPARAGGCACGEPCDHKTAAS